MFQSHQKIRYFTDFWSFRLNSLEAFNIGIFGIIWVPWQKNPPWQRDFRRKHIVGMFCKVIPIRLEKLSSKSNQVLIPLRCTIAEKTLPKLAIQYVQVHGFNCGSKFYMCISRQVARFHRLKIVWKFINGWLISPDTFPILFLFAQKYECQFDKQPFHSHPFAIVSYSSPFTEWCIELHFKWLHFAIKYFFTSSIFVFCGLPITRKSRMRSIPRHYFCHRILWAKVMLVYFV